jgi:hypothetical protein
VKRAAFTVTALALLAILACTVVGVANVWAAGSQIETSQHRKVQPQAEKFKHPKSINPCDDFALGMMVTTVVLSVVYVGRRRESAS